MKPDRDGVGAHRSSVSGCKVIVLVDDTAVSDKYMSEHGVSILVDGFGRIIVFD